MKTLTIHISGQVQGVGFRPFVYTHARKLGLTGWVKNNVNGVLIEVTGTKPRLDELIDQLKINPPLQAKIESFHELESEITFHDQFNILASDPVGKKEVRLSPDFGLCQECREDMDTAGCRRYEYPFTTCTQCGPRYSIINQLPYDRTLTEMNRFQMCEECTKEYHDPTDRRFYSQTNSCPDCGIALSLNIGGTVEASKDSTYLISKAVELLQKGKIGAVKGVGGFLLICDATNAESVRSLRRRKHRPEKPFAVMYPDLEMIRQDLRCHPIESEWLLDTRAPIVLLEQGETTVSGIQTDQIAPGLNTIGVMLPYAPLLYLIARKVGRPLIATSGNISGSPIVYDDLLAELKLSRYSDFMLTHNRHIVVPQDDSVVRLTKNPSISILLRRSRGWAPSYFGYSDQFQEGILALGAHMKGSFSFTGNGQVYVSQYLGDLESYDARLEYRKTLKHLKQILDFKPRHIVTDLHPEYFSHELAFELSGKWSVGVSFAQHHKAHFAAVLSENELTRTIDPVLGVIWDGTGYGEDGNIWGGEFFTWQNGVMKRSAHFEEHPHFLNDKMSREPRLAALAFTNGSANLKDKFNETEWNLYSKLINENKLKTTSVGRLFDAVSSILGLVDKTTYIAQGAMFLEAAATKTHPTCHRAYDIRFEEGIVYTGDILAQIIQDQKQRVDIPTIAFRFHLTLVEIIRTVVKQSGIERVAFSGGVFQNELLVSLIHQELSRDFELYFHQELSPNDENVSFGQLELHHMGLTKIVS